ncbi:hypothetical protein Tco_1272593 [Tanacetum coccineum]
MAEIRGSNSFAARFTDDCWTLKIDHLKMEMEMEIPSSSNVKKITGIAQDGDPSQDDVRLCLDDDLKKAQDHSQRQA